MGVLVCYDDFTYDVVNDYHLDYLVQSGCIIGYDKSGDWVKKDPPLHSSCTQQATIPNLVSNNLPQPSQTPPLP